MTFRREWLITAFSLKLPSAGFQHVHLRALNKSRLKTRMPKFRNATLNLLHHFVISQRLRQPGSYQNQMCAPMQKTCIYDVSAFVEKAPTKRTPPSKKKKQKKNSLTGQTDSVTNLMQLLNKMDWQQCKAFSGFCPLISSSSFPSVKTNRFLRAKRTSVWIKSHLCFGTRENSGAFWKQWLRPHLRAILLGSEKGFCLTKRKKNSSFTGWNLVKQQSSPATVYTGGTPGVAYKQCRQPDVTHIPGDKLQKKW